MKKLLISLFVLVLIVAAAGVGALYYIKPEQNLDLAYEEVPFKQRALEMARSLSFEMTLSSEDLNQLAKKSIASNPQVEKDIRVTGASFTTDHDLLIADLNIIWKDRVSAELQVTYHLNWESPNVVATVLEARMKGIPLPDTLFSERIIPIGDELPKWLKIENLIWGDGEVKVQFQKPSLEDLQKLL